MESKEIIFLKPQLKDVVWGGNKLRDEFGYEGAGDHTGECWGISAHPNGDDEIISGSFKGMSLSALYKEHREVFGGITAEEFPLLVKIIDAKQDLSIQVHPDDAYVKEHENCPYGKTECWYVMDCPENATLVIGHNANTREELADMIHENRYEELIKNVPVRKGDFLQITPGTVHAIKGGFTILETQQSSDITYRVYDYGRLVDGKERPLHVQQSIDVITVPDKAGEEALSHTDGLPVNTLNELISCEYYKVWKLTVTESVEVKQDHPFLLASVLDGSGTVDGTEVKKGDHFILPAGYGDAVFAGNMELILSSVS
ncbi:MAG: class I mannose-6-phosphate isomerase [Lachnospiraceae bacterium]|nr:class I mannose-6-phosphate isomerase [Lachnospiraceae bacterium]